MRNQGWRPMSSVVWLRCWFRGVVLLFPAAASGPLRLHGRRQAPAGARLLPQCQRVTGARSRVRVEQPVTTSELPGCRRPLTTGASRKGLPRLLPAVRPARALCTRQTKVLTRLVLVCRPG